MAQRAQSSTASHSNWDDGHIPVDQRKWQSSLWRQSFDTLSFEFKEKDLFYVMQFHFGNIDATCAMIFVNKVPAEPSITGKTV